MEIAEQKYNCKLSELNVYVCLGSSVGVGLGVGLPLVLVAILAIAGVIVFLHYRSTYCFST